MLFSTRSLRRYILCCLATACGMVGGVCAAQSGAPVITQAGNQFSNQIGPDTTKNIGFPVDSLQVGNLQGAPTPTVDILYIAHTTVAVKSVPTPAVVADLELNSQSSGTGFGNFSYDNIYFINATNVVAALPSFGGYTDYAFAITGAPNNEPNLCLYYFNPNAGSSAPYYGGDVYPPASGTQSVCITVPPPANGGLAPVFTAIAVLNSVNISTPDLVVEDSANNLLDIVSIGGPNGLAVINELSIPSADGTGPIYTGDFNGDGNTDFIVNGQSSHSATVYLSNGNGLFQQPVRYLSGHVYSMLMYDMDGATDSNGKQILDMVAEGSDGSIEIYPGKGDGTFSTTPEGGTTGNPLAGYGGQLVAIDPNTKTTPTTLNILTASPIGLSVLTAPSGTQNYTLKNIYNIGPGRQSFALADTKNRGILDLVVNSPEGMTVVPGDGNGDGGFMSSLAYPTLAPALGATVGQFRSIANNQQGCLDVVAATAASSSAVQGQLLTGNFNSNNNCDGTFTIAANPTNTTGNPSGVPASFNLWSNILSGDFNGDGNLDIAYSLTGLPLPTTGPGLYVQYGKGDGTFGSPTAVTGTSGGNTLYGESAVGNFNGASSNGVGIADIANIDANFDDTLLGQSANSFSLGLNQQESNTAFNQVAAGYFKTGRTSQQDLIFQQGSSLIPFLNKQNGTGTLTQMTALAGTPSPSLLIAGTVLLADVDGDGNGDVVVVYYPVSGIGGAPPVAPPSLYIWWGNGNGTFNTSPAITQLDRNDYLAAVADMNGDGFPDIVLCDGSVVSILYNQGSLATPANRGFGGEQQFLAGQGINSLSLTHFNGAPTPSLIVANGGATISNAIALGGATQPPPSSLALTPNPVVNTGGITVLANNVTTLPVTGSLTSTPNQSTIGESFLMTATFSSSTGVAEPTGTVAFYISGNGINDLVCNVQITPGPTSSIANCTAPSGNTYPSGTYTLSAAYSGDSNNSPYTATAQQNIQVSSTTTTLYLCVGPTASCPSVGVISPAPPYMATLSMIYGQTFNGVTGVTASNPSTLLGATVLNDVYNGVPTPPLCSLSPLSSVPCPPSVGTGTQVGTNVLTSSYVPGTLDTINGPSTSLPVTITVTPDTVNTTLTSSLNPAPQGQSVTLTATLTGVNAPLDTTASPVGFYLPPSGTVVFMDGTTALTCGTGATLVPSATGVSSTATCTTSTLPVGTHPITVSYGGSLDFQPTTSATPFNETITALAAPTFTIAVSPNPVTVNVGYGTLLTVTVTAQNGFAEDVNLSCGNLPTEATCTFAPPTVSGGNGTSQLIVETTAPHDCGTTQPYFFAGNGGAPLAPLALPALAGLVAIFIPGRRRWLRALLAVLLAAAIGQIAGCGNCTDLGTRPATYTIQVIGTSTGTSQVQSQAVTINATI